MKPLCTALILTAWCSHAAAADTVPTPDNIVVKCKPSFAPVPPAPFERIEKIAELNGRDRDTALARLEHADFIEDTDLGLSLEPKSTPYRYIFAAYKFDTSANNNVYSANIKDGTLRFHAGAIGKVNPLAAVFAVDARSEVKQVSCMHTAVR